MGAASQDAATEQDGEDDLAILFPGRTETIAGLRVAMRELNFVESLQHGGQIAALVKGLATVAMTGNKLADLDLLREVFADRHDQVLELIAASCDQPIAWVRSLEAEDGENLLLLWWTVNADFFLRRVLTRVQLALLQRVGARDGQTSLPPSSTQATTPSASATTRTAN